MESMKDFIRQCRRANTRTRVHAVYGVDIDLGNLEGHLWSPPNHLYAVVKECHWPGQGIYINMDSLTIKCTRLDTLRPAQREKAAKEAILYIHRMARALQKAYNEVQNPDLGDRQELAMLLFEE